MKFDYYTRQGVIYGSMIRSLMNLEDTDPLDASTIFHISRGGNGRVIVRDPCRDIIIIEGKSQNNRSEYRSLSFSPNGGIFTMMGVSFKYIDITEEQNAERLMALSKTQRFINGIYYALYGCYGLQGHTDGSTFIELSRLEKLFPLPDGVQI